MFFFFKVVFNISREIFLLSSGLGAARRPCLPTPPRGAPRVPHSPRSTPALCQEAPASAGPHPVGAPHARTGGNTGLGGAGIARRPGRGRAAHRGSRQVDARQAQAPPPRGGGADPAGRTRRAGRQGQGVGARGQRTQPLRSGRRHWAPGMNLTRKKGFYKPDVNRTAWELPKTYVSPTHLGSGAYGSVW